MGLSQAWLRTAFTALPAFPGAAGRFWLARPYEPSVFYHSAKPTQYLRDFIDNLFTFF
jgi:hypothetical protein